MTKPKRNWEGHTHTKLWCDLNTDQEKAEYLRSGDAWSAGIISRAIEKEVAEAFQFRADFNKTKEKGEND